LGVFRIIVNIRKSLGIFRIKLYRPFDKYIKDYFFSHIYIYINMSIERNRPLVYTKTFLKGDYLMIPDDPKKRIFTIDKINDVYVEQLNDDGDMEEIINPKLDKRYFASIGGSLSIGEFRHEFPASQYYPLIGFFQGDKSLGPRVELSRGHGYDIYDLKNSNAEIFSCDLLNLPEYDYSGDLRYVISQIDYVYNSNIEKRLTSMIPGLENMPKKEAKGFSLFDDFLSKKPSGGKKYKQKTKKANKAKKTKKANKKSRKH